MTLDPSRPVNFSSINLEKGGLRWLLAAVALALVLFMFQGPLEAIVSTWMNSEEYNYGPIVPLLCALMIWRDLRRTQQPVRSSWVGVAIIAAGLALGLIEALSQIHFPGQLGLFVCVIGIFVALEGTGRSWAVWPGLIFLFFALPLVSAVQVKLTVAMQLLSSQGSVHLIRVFGLPVFREGNVIDLGLIKLQVAEACSGLRYLFPLATFTFLCAYLFNSRPATRVFIFLSSIPITIGMNIFRIAVTAVLVDRYGIEAAEGFFHSFEGWAVYCLCLALLFLEMKVLCYIDGSERSVIRRLDFDIPARVDSRAGVSSADTSMGSPRRVWRPLALACVLIVGAIGMNWAIGARQNVTLTRLAFDAFPHRIDSWQGTEAPIDRDSLRALNATDYLSLNYSDASEAPINVWIAFYESQYSGNSAHSPEVCIPGGGWQIESDGQVKLPIDDGAVSRVLSVNRLVIIQSGQRQLVYYWFVEAGKTETNEYRAKLNLVLSAVLHNRRDGALVRFVTPVNGGDLASADARIRAFIGRFLPLLPPYLPI